ncbi:serine/threonine protein phosphatase [Kribbella sp. ALI-6-A]|uniref:PP2C family protein-serine/threonine phosphatase n=1 Tax=Kribbella sp. ALI-6-A TaxID=1933817 RepID=UPI00097C5679|nr:SpoIIE family protein phosphatase [Kribbella sp. ALI-6-A]ONI73907.1 serine/threonine protein phosphatase [Kribbella sp. ALI-6-A]
MTSGGTIPDDVRNPLLADSAAVRAEIVDEVGLAMTGSLNLRRCVLQLLTGVKPDIADWAVVVWVNPRTGGLTLWGGDDPSATAKTSRRSIAGQALERVLVTGHTELLHVALEDPASDALATMIPNAGLREQAAALRPVDVLGLGLTARGVTLGALVMVRGQGRGFSEQDVAVGEQLAARASLALDSARLYEQTSRVAAALKESLVPPELPAIPGLDIAARYRPAIEHLDIGGDFYDVFTSGDEWLAVLGDVCGKGVDAAVLTGRARQSIRTAAHFEREPGALLAAFNTVFSQDTSNRFITLVCLRMRPAADGSSAEVDIAVAGHAGPVLVRADGRTEQLPIEGTVAGVVPRVDYPTTTVRLEQGDALLVFTDGVEEARGESGFYGTDRLIRLLREYAGAGADAMCGAVEQDVVEHLDGRAHDDIAVLAISCGGTLGWQS